MQVAHDAQRVSVHTDERDLVFRVRGEPSIQRLEHLRKRADVCRKEHLVPSGGEPSRSVNADNGLTGPGPARHAGRSVKSSLDQGALVGMQKHHPVLDRTAQDTGDVLGRD